MENATHALSMAFAVMVFVVALTVSMVSFNKVKQVSDTILYTKDETNYYEYQGATGKGAENRIVGLETIIPTLYKYYKEDYTVVFKKGSYNYKTGEITNWEYLPVYETQREGKREENWADSYEELMKKKYGDIKNDSIEIFSFDLYEETLRHEPWTGDYNKIKDNLECFLKGDKFINPNDVNPNDEGTYIDYSKGKLNGGFIKTYGDAKFVETIVEYTYDSSQAVDTTLSGDITQDKEDLTKDRAKRMIIYTWITNS